MKKYIGWVPSVFGSLFFEHVHCSENFKSRAHKGYLNTNVNKVEDDYIRYIAFSTWIGVRDEEKYAEELGQFKVVLLSTSNFNDTDIKGNLYMHRNASPNIKAHEKKLDKLEKRLKNIEIKHKKEESVKTEYTKIKNLADSIDCLYKINFSIDRFGFLILEISMAPDDEQSKDTLSSQAYYFIKDSFHLHKHHEANDDRITGVHRFDESKPVGMNMINDLKQSLVTDKLKIFKKTIKKNNNIKYTGVVAYAKSLIEACRVKGYITPDEYRSELMFFDNFLCSVKCRIEEEKNNIQEKRFVISAFKSSMVLILTLIAPFILLFKDNIVSSQIVSQGNSEIGPVTALFLDLLSVLYLNMEFLLILLVAIVSSICLWWRNRFNLTLWNTLKKISTLRLLRWLSLLAAIALYVFIVYFIGHKIWTLW